MRKTIAITMAAIALAAGAETTPTAQNADVQRATATGASLGMHEAMQIANAASCVVVSKLGTAMANLEEIAAVLAEKPADPADRKIVPIENWPEGRFVRKAGGKAVVLKRVAGYSTTAIADKMKAER